MCQKEKVKHIISQFWHWTSGFVGKRKLSNLHKFNDCKENNWFLLSTFVCK